MKKYILHFLLIFIFRNKEFYYIFKKFTNLIDLKTKFPTQFHLFEYSGF